MNHYHLEYRYPGLALSQWQRTPELDVVPLHDSEIFQRLVAPVGWLEFFSMDDGWL